jgi:hypothetical protein
MLGELASSQAGDGAAAAATLAVEKGTNVKLVTAKAQA